MKTTAQRIDELLGITKQKRYKLKELLAQCTNKQVNLFNRMYGSVDAIPKDKLDWAIIQCLNTLKE
jgi:hypothetical protein